MSDLFLKILNMSISASWLVLAVLLLRFILKKVPKWINVLLWGIVAVRLICPFAPESAVSLIPDSVGSGEFVSEWVNDYIGDTDTHYSGSVDYDAAVGAGREPIFDGAGRYYVVTKHDQLGEPSTVENTVIPVLALVWGSGVILLALYTAVSYWRLHRKVSEAVILRDNIFQSENVASPFVLGIFKPKVYLSYNMDEKDLEHVIAHEQAHIRRRDHWWKPLGFLLLTVHWFNPLMWLAYALLCRDIELACDEKVIKELGSEQRADYTQALVVCSVNRRMIAACPLAFGEVGVKDRVKSVMNYEKPTFWVVLLAVIACVAVAVCFLTDPVGFRFDEAAHTIVSANHFDMRTDGDAAAVEMNSSQISELSSRLAGVKNAGKSDEYGGFTPGYQISALLEDGTYIRISGYSLSDNDMVDIEWNGERYVVSDEEFQDYLSRICGGGDTSSANHAAGKTYLYEGEGMGGSFTITLYEDGTFTYYEGMLSSYIGDGTFMLDGDTVVMTDDSPGGYGLVNRFRRDGDDLVFVEKDSDNFVYVKVKDGERFRCTGEAVKLGSDTDESRLKLQENTVAEIGRGTLKSAVELNDEDAASLIRLIESGNWVETAEMPDEYIDCAVNLGGRLLYYCSKNGTFIEYNLSEVTIYSHPAPSGGRYWTLGMAERLFVNNILCEYIDLMYGITDVAPPEEGPDESGYSDSLDAAISTAVLQHYAADKPDGLLHVTSHAVFHQETKQTGKTMVFAMSLLDKYGFAGAAFHEVESWYEPIILTFEHSDQLGYRLSDSWFPTRPAGSWEALSEEIYTQFSAYSEDLADSALIAIYDDIYRLELKRSCYDQAVRYAGVDTHDAIESLFEMIEDTPGAEGDPQGCINMHYDECRRLKYFGNYTLEYIFSEFLEGGQTGLRGHLMRKILDDLAPEARLRLHAETGQAYFDEWKAAAIRVGEQHDMGWIKEHQPAIWLLLQIIDE